MPTAIQIAADLRKMADHFEGLGDKELIKPTLQFNALSSEKPVILAAISSLPHPFSKDYGDDEKYAMSLFEHKGIYVDVDVVCYRDKVCRIVEPARGPVYQCEPLLSQEEESSVGVEA